MATSLYSSRLAAAARPRHAARKATASSAAARRASAAATSSRAASSRGEGSASLQKINRGNLRLMFVSGYKAGGRVMPTHDRP